LGLFDFAEWRGSEACLVLQSEEEAGLVWFCRMERKQGLFSLRVGENVGYADNLDIDKLKEESKRKKIEIYIFF